MPKEDWLQFADADALDFQRFISSPRGRGFPADNVFLMVNDKASYQAMRKWMGTTLPRKVQPEDTVYIYVATHGLVESEASRDAYLLAYDSEREDLWSSAFRMKDLADIMQTRLKAKRVLLFADACRAGNLQTVNSTINNYLEAAGAQRAGLLASKPREFSHEGPQFGGGHGVFTYFLLRGLMGAADEDGDKTITLNELIRYVQAQVAAATDKKQNVREFGDIDGGMPLAFSDKPGPSDLKISSRPERGRVQLASLTFRLPQGEDLRAQFERALGEGKLLPPDAPNASDLYRRISAAPGAIADRDDLRDELVIALATAGEKVISDYRRGDQVVVEPGRYERAAALFQRAVELDPEDLENRAKASFLTGRALIAHGRLKEAEAPLRRAIEMEPEAAHSYNALGILEMEQGQYREAIGDFRAAMKRAPRWIYPRSNLGRTLTALGRLSEAEQEFRAALQVGSDLRIGYSYLHYNLAMLYLAQRRPSEAQNQFQQAIALNSRDARSYYHLGVIAQDQGRGQEAQKMFEKAIAADASFTEASVALARLFHSERDHAREMQVLERAAQAPGAAPEALRSIALVFAAHQQFDRAEQLLLRLLGQHPDSPAAFEALGDLHAAQKRLDEAAEDYRQALARTTAADARRELEKKLAAVERKVK